MPPSIWINLAGAAQHAPPFGIIIGAAIYPLEGQPPVARGGAWWPYPRHYGYDG